MTERHLSRREMLLFMAGMVGQISLPATSQFFPVEKKQTEYLNLTPHLLSAAINLNKKVASQKPFLQKVRSVRGYQQTINDLLNRHIIPGFKAMNLYPPADLYQRITVNNNSDNSYYGRVENDDSLTLVFPSPTAFIPKVAKTDSQSDLKNISIQLQNPNIFPRDHQIMMVVAHETSHLLQGESTQMVRLLDINNPENQGIIDKHEVSAQLLTLEVICKNLTVKPTVDPDLLAQVTSIFSDVFNYAALDSLIKARADSNQNNLLLNSISDPVIRAFWYQEANRLVSNETNRFEERYMIIPGQILMERLIKGKDRINNQLSQSSIVTLESATKFLGNFVE